MTHTKLETIKGRIFTSEEAKAMRRLYAQIPQPPLREIELSDEYLHALFDQGSTVVLAREKENHAVVGMIFFSPSYWAYTDWGYGCALVVDEQYRYKGIGTLLVQKLVQLATKAQNTHLLVAIDAEITGLGATKILTALGFTNETIGELRKGYVTSLPDGERVGNSFFLTL